MKFYPHCEEDIREMLDEIKLDSMESLFSHLPENILFKGNIGFSSEGMSELELENFIREKCNIVKTRVIFAGAGCYDHFVPSFVDFIASRSEFFTAYTPYQPEASQGILQAIFEYQSVMCELTGMDVSNASHYDGATSLAEAVIMLQKIKKGKIIVPDSLHPEYRKVLETYIRDELKSLILNVPNREGLLDMDFIYSIDEDISSIIVQSPNFFGLIEDVANISKIAREKDARLIMCANPITFGVLKSPGELGVDVAVGEAQPLGLPMYCGGETLGYFCAKKEFLRKMPGRIAGMTKDKEGKRGYVLTLQTREQHIRREKATSNICSNQALNALRVLCYLSYMGKEGLKDVCVINMKNARVLYEKLKKENVEILFDGNIFFNEFAFKVKNVDAFFNDCRKKGILPGIKLELYYPELKNFVLTAVTETKSMKDIDEFAKVIVNNK